MELDDQQHQDAPKEAEASSDESLEAADDESTYEESFQHFVEGPASSDSDDHEPETDEGQGVREGGDAELEDDQEYGDESSNNNDQNDIWTDVPVEAHEAYKAERERADKLEHANKSETGRVSGLRRTISNLQAQLATAPKADAKGNADGQGGVSDEEAKKFRSEYPEIAGPVEKMMTVIRKENEGLRTQVASHDTDRHIAGLEREAEALTQSHEDWETVVVSEGFGHWLTQQPQYVQEAAMRNGNDIVNSEEAGDIIARFKSQTGRQQPESSDTANAEKAKRNIAGKRKRQLDSAATIPSRTLGAGSGPPDDFDSAFQHFASKS